MPQRRSKVVTWRPRGASDCIESSQSFQGAMTLLTNLIPDPTTKGLFECRPAAFQIVPLQEFEQLHPISIMQVFGNYAYGMVQSDINTAFDVPFVIDLVNLVPVLVSGFSIGTNTPYSQPTTGPWVPPTMDAIGSKIVVTHPGFSGTGFFFGYFDISTPSAPVWHGGNCSGANFSGFLAVPTFVRQFDGRAWFIQNYIPAPAVIFSDVNNPLTNSGGGIVPILTFGDTQPLTALGGLPLNNQLGGIIQALMVFKGVSNIYQITGDPSLGNLVLNTLNIPTGTLAPRSVVPTPKGLSFVSPDGLRIIDFDARVSDPIGFEGQGITLPFISCPVPSRIAASANGEVYRVTVQNGAAYGQPLQEWWYDFGRSVWHGPHTSVFTSLSPYKATFIGVFSGINGALYQSDYLQNATSSFIENSVQLTWNYLSVLFPDTDRMTQNWQTETTVDLQLDAEVSQVVAMAVAQDFTILDSVFVSVPGSLPIWGTAVWGAFTWAGTGVPLIPLQIAWGQPLSFARMALLLQGSSSGRFRIGAIHMRYTDTGIFINYAAQNLSAAFRLDISELGGPNVLG